MGCCILIGGDNRIFCKLAKVGPDIGGLFLHNNNSGSGGSLSMRLDQTFTDATIEIFTHDENCLFIQASSYENWCQCYWVTLQFGQSAGDLAVSLIESELTGL